MEIERLRKSLDVYKKTVKGKCSEIESKNKLINKLIEDKTRIESTNEVMEEEFDIDNLLHVNLGEVYLTHFNLSDSAFPEDLESLDMSNFVSDQAQLSLSPASLAMATNTTYVVQEEQELNQSPKRDPNWEGSTEIDQTVERKGLVGRMVDQKRSYLSTQESIIESNAKQKVSPIKILEGEKQYQLASRNIQLADNDTPYKKLKLNPMSPKASSPAPSCLSCPHCGKQFPLGGQWKLTRHISSFHSSSMLCSCQYCDKQFPCQSILTAHTEWHMLTNPWKCEECGSGCNVGNLTHFIKHVKSVHRVTSLARARRLLLPANAN